MSRHKKRTEEHTNHERWLVSYADFITLLFAFFVVMYSISSVNEGKYRVLSETFNEAFRDQKRSVEPIQVGEVARSLAPEIVDGSDGAMIETVDTASLGPENTAPLDGTPAVAAGEEKRLGYIAGSIESVLGPFIDQKLVEVKHTQFWVEVSMRSKMLFDSGSARLSRAAVKVLADISKILKPLPNPIHVEGYTDNVPIRTQVFPSNWELSAARAASVVHLFSRFGVAPARMAAIGFGEHRPVADNATEAGRQKNRRVALIILANQRPREERDVQTPAGRASLLSRPEAVQPSDRRGS